MPAAAAPTVSDTSDAISVDNGLVSFSVSKSSGGTLGEMTSLALGDVDFMSESATRGYYSANRGPIGSGTSYWELGLGETEFSYVAGEDFVDVAIRHPSDSGMPYDLTQHYVLRDGETGFHTYSTIHHSASDAAYKIEEMRYLFRANPSMFTHHWVADDRFSVMPTIAEYNAASIVQDATVRLQPGTAYEAETGKDVYTKYDWSVGLEEEGVYGLYGDQYGMWLVQPNKESFTGGPTKQELTVHQTNTTPVLLGMLIGQHYGTTGHVETPGDYDRTYGPFYVHLNTGDSPQAMVGDAATYYDVDYHQAFYDSLGIGNWIDTTDRSQVSGSLQIGSATADERAVVVLADNHTDFQFSKYGYQYWTRAAADGSFDLSGVRPGTYRLSVYSAGTFGEMRIDDVTVGTGASLDLGQIHWQPPDHGADLWQIGTFDRTAEEFRYGANNEYRQYGMWERYADDFPADVDFVIGESDEATDWNFAHWEHVDGQTSPVWNVQFEVGELPDDRDVTLTIAVAGQQSANLRVRVNGTIVENNWDLDFSGSILSRSGAWGPYQSREIQFLSSLLVAGINTITLSHPSPGSSDTDGIIYDALRLEIDILEGDYNNNGVIDAADYTVWRDRLHTGAEMPNDLSPGVVDEHDYEVWIANFGKSRPALAGGQPVPEPAFGWLLSIGAGVLAAAKRPVFGREKQRARSHLRSAP